MREGGAVMRTTALVLAAGQGKRMGSSVHKQYLLLRGKPVLYYSLKAFEDSRIDDIVLVIRANRHFVEKKSLRNTAFTRSKPSWKAAENAITLWRMAFKRFAGHVTIFLYMTVQGRL